MGVAYEENVEFAITENVPFPPQSWEFEVDIKELNKIDTKHIISYYPDGSVCSFYGDNVWRFTYSLNERRWGLIDFTHVINHEDRALAKRLMFSVLYFSRGKGGTIKAPQSLVKFYGQAINPMSDFASKEGITLQMLFENRQLMHRYITSIVKPHKSRSTINHRLLIFLKGLDRSVSNVNYDFDIKHKQRLIKYHKEYEDERGQTECIPPRILQNALQMRWKHIDTVVGVLPKLIMLIDRLLKEPTNYRSRKSGVIKKAQKSGVKHFRTFAELIIELGLEAFCEQYKIRDRNRLAEYLSGLTRTSRHLLYGYTGMRNDEGNTLLVGCYRSKGAGEHPVIIGIEKKNGAPVEHPFVTINEIKKVIDLNEAITKAISKYTHPHEEYLPLLFNPQWIRNGSKKFIKHMEADSKLRSPELKLDESRLILTAEEMELTLKATEPDRDWDNDENYRIGEPWKFKYHQYRRSIAVYALNTGLVSLTALGKQFRHLFEATTAHYGNGHFIAEPLAGTDSKYHVKHEMDNQREYYEGLTMFRDMMFNLEHPKSSFAPEQDDLVSIDPQEQILNPEIPSTIAKKIKNNELSYANTAIGSCKSSKPCDGHIMLFYAGCVECDDAVVNDKKLEHTINNTQEFKRMLEKNMPNSVELRDIQSELLELTRLQQKKKGR